MKWKLVNCLKLWKRLFIRDQAPYREHSQICLFICPSTGWSICPHSLHRVVHNVIYKIAENSTCKFCDRHHNTNEGCRIRLHQVYQSFWLSIYVLLLVILIPWLVCPLSLTHPFDHNFLYHFNKLKSYGKEKKESKKEWKED